MSRLVLTGAGALGGALVLAASAAAFSGPTQYTAHRLTTRPGAARFGAAVPAGAIFGTRVFTTAKRGVALAQVGQAQYPALSTDGGAHWAIDGPPLHVDAANAPAAVNAIGATGRTVYAYGPSVLDVSPDGGTTWWQVFTDQYVSAVVPGLHGLAAYLQDSGETRQFVSRDGGRHWAVSSTLGG